MNWPVMNQSVKNFANTPALIRLIGAGIFVVLFTLTLRSLNGGVAQAPDYSEGQPGPEVVVEILPGESGSEIGEKLESLGVVKSSLAFFRAAVVDERAARIAPGEHLLETRIPAKQALNQLLDPKRIPNLIEVRDGARWMEIRESLITFGLAASDIDRSYKGLKLVAPFSDYGIEGFLYPAQYSFNKGVAAEEIIGAMIEKFKWITRDISWQGNSKFSPYDLMIIASLVESEGTPEVFGQVARVIYNRIEKGMPLQFDSTVHYALRTRGEIRVSLSQTKVQSKYNTYIYRGLPPTPIGSPTLKAIQAALNPTQGDWLYFVTVKPGETRFTNSYDEFLVWKAEYKRNFRAGLFE
ncbi:MAG: hypothetical protein RL029_122 [Actinomycetota bacterium]|jgi:UPF0755 protein